jgi:alpha-beta hydrolase superfamily lysophospholipase
VSPGLRPRPLRLHGPWLPDGAWIAASLHLPPLATARSGALLVCSPGGTYSRSSVDLRVPGRPGYSMAAHLTARGHYVLAVDTLGTGGSTRPADGDLVTMDVAARALAGAVAEAADETGREFGGWRSVIGIGHSLGAAVTVAAQAVPAHAGLASGQAGPFDAIAVLGYSPTWRSVPAAGLDPADRQAVLAALTEADPPLWSGSYIRFGRAATRDFAHFPDVPDAVIRAADRDQLPVPRGLAVDFGITGPALRAATAVQVPVYLGFGERDAAARPDEEAARYPASQGVTLHMLPGSGHCQYTASARAVLWDRLDQWVNSVTAAREGIRGQS